MKDTVDETTYTIEVMVRLLESVKISVGNSVCVNDVHHLYEYVLIYCTGRLYYHLRPSRPNSRCFLHITGYLTWNGYKAS